VLCGYVWREVDQDGIVGNKDLSTVIYSQASAAGAGNEMCHAQRTKVVDKSTVEEKVDFNNGGDVLQVRVLCGRGKELSLDSAGGESKGAYDSGDIVVHRLGIETTELTPRYDCGW
jgi:hypothetical protein